MFLFSIIFPLEPVQNKMLLEGRIYTVSSLQDKLRRALQCVFPSSPAPCPRELPVQHHTRNTRTHQMIYICLEAALSLCVICHYATVHKKYRSRKWIHEARDCTSLQMKPGYVPVLTIHLLKCFELILSWSPCSLFVHPGVKGLWSKNSTAHLQVAAQ